MNEKTKKSARPLWKRLLSESIVTLDALPLPPPVHRKKLERVISR